MSKKTTLFWEEAAKKIDPEVLDKVIGMIANAPVDFEQFSETEWEDEMKNLYKFSAIWHNVTEIVQNDLEKAIVRYERGNWDETDAFDDLLAKGYTLDDFRYDPVRYEWAKRIAEEHGLA